jgi:hypothetical protein
MIDVDADGCPRYEEALKVAAGRHDLSVIRVTDPREQEIPDVGLVHVKDSETGAAAWVNTSSRAVRTRYAEWFRTLSDREKHLFNQYQIDSVDIATDGDYVKGLMSLFQHK